MRQLLHIAARSANQRVWIPKFVAALREFGELSIVEHGEGLAADAIASRIRGCDVLLTGWGSVMTPASLATEPGRLRYICHITGEMRRVVPLEVIESEIPVTNWGNAQADYVAERAMLLLLGALKEIHRRVVTIRDGGWRLDESAYGGSLRGLEVGIYGLGFIGRRFVELLLPFRPVVRVFDPYAADVPDGCQRVATLDELFAASQAIVVHCGLTPETRGSVNRERLAMLPDHGIVINTARGGIIDQEALFAELETGRLRAGLDVLEPDRLPPDHPARLWPNLLLTAHQGLHDWPLSPGEPPNTMQPMHEICLDNLRRFVAGEPLLFKMDRERYERST